MQRWIQISKWGFVISAALFCFDCFLDYRTSIGSILPASLARLVILVLVISLPGALVAGYRAVEARETRRQNPQQ